MCTCLIDAVMINFIAVSNVQETMEVKTNVRITEKIDRLREQMEEKNIDIYIIPTADFHHSEYVSDYFKTREFMTGFTGSAGTAVFTRDKAGLWTDGRYFIQAEQQLDGSDIILFKTGEAGVPTIREFIDFELPAGGIIGFDGRTAGVNEGLEYQEAAELKKGTVEYEYDLVGLIWEERPKLPGQPAFLLAKEYAGESVAAKLERVRQVMDKEDATVHILTSLDDIGWLLNLRGNDIRCFPFVLCYAAVWMDKVVLYADKDKFSAAILAEFLQLNISVQPYESLYDDVGQYDSREVVMLDPERVNYMLYANIHADVIVLQKENPVILMKAVKNDIEVANARLAHIKDGIANTRFMYWLKTNRQLASITEQNAAARLEEFRREQEHYLGPSFDPICAYQEHGAIVHYSAILGTDVPLADQGFLLTDTGGHYLNGSTDITRTYALGDLSRQEKEHFTTVVISMLCLADVKFLYGCNGVNLDIVAREPFWRQNLDFNHGAGHGVGHLGNIHEAPIAFRWRKGKTEMPPFEENMIITDEPGIYIEGSYGIRIENELLVRKGEKNEYGQFMYFEPLTFTPIDLDAVLPELMSGREIDLLNAYHQQVYQQISPYLTGDERIWLQEYTRPVTRN